MSTYSDSGIVIGLHNLGESDKIINIYTRENGLVRAIAKGAKKPKSKFRGKLDIFSSLKFQFARGKNLDIICDVEQVNSFFKLRKNLNLVSHGMLFVEIVKNFAEENELESEFTFDLLYSSLFNLQETKEDLDLFSIKFILEFLSIHGFRPMLENCVSCSIEAFDSTRKNIFYSCELGGVLCKNCSSLNHEIISLNTFNILKETDSLITDYGIWAQENVSKEHESLFNECKKEDIRNVFELLKKHISTRAKSKINSFDLVFSL